MKKIILISCSKKKMQNETKAEKLYISPLFKKSLKFAKMQKPNNIYILSAEYELLDLNSKIKPYEKTLNKMKKCEREKWSKKVINMLKIKSDLKKDKYIILAGVKYREFLIDKLENYEIPLKGKRIGIQLKWLNEQLKNSND